MYELLKAEFRDDKFKAPLKAMRKEGYVPGCIYGKDFDGVNFKVPFSAAKKFFAHSGQVFEVEVTGHGKHLVSIDNLQWDHFGDKLMHVAFHKIAAGHETTLKLPIVIHGEAAGIKAGGIVQQVLNEVECKGLPKDFPEYIEVMVDELDVHGHISLGDIKAPKGLTFVSSLEANIVSCHPPKVEIVPEVEEVTEVVAEEAAVEAPAAEEKEAA